MSKTKIKAVVLSSRPHKEKDRIIKLLSADHGIISACAPGAGKINGKHGSTTRPGILSEFIVSESKGFYYIAESDLIYSFPGIEKSIEHLTALAHVLDIAQDAAMDATSGSNVFALLLYTMHALSQHKDYRIVVSAFEWKLMHIIGFSISIDEYYSIEEGGCYFSFESCRLYPFSKRPMGSTVILTVGCLEALRFIQNASLDKLFSFSVTEEVLELLSMFTRRYLCERLDSKYCKLDLLQYSIENKSEI